MYGVMSPTNSDSFTSFPVRTLFISFSSLIALERTSKTLLNKSDRNRHSCLVLILEEMLSAFQLFSFSLLSMRLAEGLSYMAFIMLR